MFMNALHGCDAKICVLSDFNSPAHPSYTKTQKNARRSKSKPLLARINSATLPLLSRRAGLIPKSAFAAAEFCTFRPQMNCVFVESDKWKILEGNAVTTQNHSALEWYFKESTSLPYSLW